MIRNLKSKNKNCKLIKMEININLDEKTLGVLE